MYDPPVDWRANNAMNYSPNYPQPHLTNMRDISGEIGEYGQRPGEGFNEEMFYEAPNNPFSGIFGAIANKFKREPNPALEAELAALQQNKGYLDSGEFVGRYGDGKYDMYDSITTPGGTEDIQILRSKNEPGKSWLGSETFDEAKEKKLAWVGKRLAAGKKVRADLVRWFRNETGTSDRFTDDNRLLRNTAINLKDLGDSGKGGATVTTQGYTGPKTYDFNRAQAVKAGSYNRTAGPMSGSYGPWKAEGGRIGYANGEFVDEDVNIAGPGFDVNENIEMASGEGEGDILEQLIAKYIEAGFPPEQAQAMAMQELQQMVAQSGQGEGQGEGIASLV